MERSVNFLCTLLIAMVIFFIINYIQNDYNKKNDNLNMIIMRNYLLEKIDLTDDEQIYYDLNNDGKIDSADLLIMKKRILNKKENEHV